MTPERRERIEQICGAALDRDAGARAAFLAHACAGDEALRREVESLLAYEHAAEQFIETPALQSAAESLTALAGLAPGEHIGTYAVVSLLGSGGMGDVYRARDPELGRDVAIKVLPPIFSTDPERMIRFEREARVLASLNHPNIGAIYGLERTAVSRALVLELVEGPTLADRLRDAARHSGSGLALPDALAIGRQIASALEAAHEKGIVHRDLKPANIKITPDGTVKVLDFGLAKLAVQADAGSEPHGSDAPRVTVTGPREGVVLGTAAYMSPEQARGQAVDKRTDIWAFGCVLYEMLTGRAAFARETVTDTMAAVVEADPDWSRLPADTPGSIRRLLRRCLRKPLQNRLRDIGDAALEIEEAQRSSHPDRRKVDGWPRRYERRLWAAAAAILLVSTLLLAARFLVTRSQEITPEPSRVARLMINAPSGAEFTINAGDRVLAISPDGTHIAYVGNPARWQLFVRPLERLDARPLTDGRDRYAVPSFRLTVAGSDISPARLSGRFRPMTARRPCCAASTAHRAAPVGVPTAPSSSRPSTPRRVCGGSRMQAVRRRS